jgi:aspartate carbamoyltransferase regulatory subunit
MSSKKNGDAPDTQIVVEERHAIEALKILSGTPNISLEIKGGKAFFTMKERRPQKDSLFKAAILFPELEVYQCNRDTTRRVSIDLPELLVGVMNCPNPLCVTSQPKEPAIPEIRVLSAKPLKLRCEYCGRYVPTESVNPSLMQVNKFIPRKVDN